MDDETRSRIKLVAGGSRSCLRQCFISARDAEQSKLERKGPSGPYWLLLSHPDGRQYARLINL
jgi:hypothetical protein